MTNRCKDCENNEGSKVILVDDVKDPHCSKCGRGIFSYENIKDRINSPYDSPKEKVKRYIKEAYKLWHEMYDLDVTDEIVFKIAMMLQRAEENKS